MSKHLLLVDDDIDELKLLEEVLDDMEPAVKISYAANANECINQIKKEMPDYILADFNMPGVNGFDLLKQARVMDNFNESAFYIYSTYMDVEVVGRALKAGAKGWIHKPRTMTMLYTTIKKLLANQLVWFTGPFNGKTQ